MIADICFRGFSGGYVKEYIEASNPAFSIGEYWDSLAYEGGNLCYNQGKHCFLVVHAALYSSKTFHLSQILHVNFLETQ